MDFTYRPFRDEWLNPGEPKPEQTKPADDGTLPGEATGLAPSTALKGAHEVTPPEEAAVPPPRAALTAARGVAPESLTFTQWLSRELVLPEQLVRQTPAQALEELRARQLESNPHLAAWAGKSVQNAAHARENVEYLNRFRDAFADFDAAYRPQKEQSFGEFMDSMGKPGEMLMHGASEVAQNVGRVLTHGMADVNAAFAGSALAVAENVFGRDSAPARWARSARDWADWARPEKVQADTKLGQFGYDALRIAPQMAATIAAGVANPVVAAGVMGSQIFGSSYNELRGKGVSPLSAALNAGANAAMQLPMERLGLEKLLRAIRTTGTKEALKNWIGAALTEGLTEGAQKAPEFVTHLWAEAEREGATTGERVDWFAKQLTDADNLMQATREAIYEGLLGAVWGGAFGGVGAVRSFRQERERSKGPDALARLLNLPEIREALTAEAERAGVMAQRQALGNALAQAASELEGAPAANDPAALREMTEAVLPEQFRQAWIGPDDAARLFQGAQARGEGEAAALLETLGTDEAGLAQAAEQGDVLPVSTAAVLAQLKGEGRAAVMDALRATPDGVSGTEAAAYDPEARAEKLVRSVLGMEEEGGDGGRDAGDALREARSAQKVRADVAREITRITQEIEAAGYPRHAAQTFARLLEHEAITAHTVYGVDPVSFILQRVSVARGEQAAEDGLGQAAMYAANDGSIADFVTRVRDEGPKGKKSFYAFQVPGELEGWEVRLPSDVVLHMKSRHPEVTEQDIALVPEVLSRLDATTAVQTGTRQFGPAYVGVADVDGKSYGISFSVAKNGVLYLNTFFRDSPENLRAWLEQKKEAFKGRADRAGARTHDSRVTHDKPLERTLKQELEEVKKSILQQQEQQLFQTAPSIGSPAFKKWFGKSKVVDEKGEPLTVYHGTGATVGEDFGFDYRFSGKNGSADGYGFYFTSDENTAKDYQEKGGSLVKAYLTLQKPMPVKQKPFSKAVLKKILKKAVEKEIEQFPDETPDYRDSFLSNYTDTYEMSFDRALNEAVEMIYEAETALEQISEIANASGNKRATAEAVRAVTGYDSVFANGYGDKGAEGGKIYVAWFPEQVKSVENRGSWNAADPRIFFQSAYHGSPYHFDQFTLDHMGSGEGAQVHGWGLYFAADKNVSEEYRKRLGSIKYYDGKRELGGAEARAARFLLNDAGEKRALAEAKAEVRKYTDPGTEQDQLLAHVRDLMEKDVTRKKGQLYEVDIPENDELLDEQKTLAEQAEGVKEALERGADSMPDDEIEANMAEYLYQALEDGADVTGRELYQALAQLGTVDYEERLEISPDGARAASEFLNSLGIKGITYVGHEDGRCFVVFDDKAISILNTFYQTRKPVEANSAALGVPEGSDIREYIKAAKRYHDRLRHESEHGKPVVQPELGKPVRFSRRGWFKNANSGADSRKWQLFPYLREIIESSKLIRTEDATGRKDGYIKAHWLENDILLDGQPLKTGITLLEDKEGNLFYNLTADISAKEKPQTKLPDAQSPGRKGLHQDEVSPGGNTITPDPDGVNLTLREATPGAIRGSVTLSPQEAAIRVFADKDLSTVPHEAAHIFLDDLLRIAADDGSLALANMRAALEAVLPRMGEGMRAEILGAVDAAAKATPETLAEALHDAATGLRARAQDARATVRLNRETALTLRREAGVAEDYKAPAGEAAPWDEFENEARRAGNDAADFTRAANIVARAAQHVRALEQARSDVAELREWAGIAPDAELQPGTEEYTRFHEAVARGFEQYLMEGKAPSRKLEGVFSRLRQWLLRIYASAREQLGLPINDNVRRVFDRMLATDAEVRQQQGLRRTMQAEREFADSGLLYFDELEALNELRNEAERAVTAEMDKATLRERNKRFRAYYSDALRDLEASPFWEMVGALSKRDKSAAGDASIGGINKEGVVRLLGPAAAADLARARPGLLNAKGHGLPIDLAAMEYGYEDEDALAHDLYDALVVRGESKQKLARALAEQRLAEDDSAAGEDALLHGSESYAAYLDKVDEVVARMAYARGLRTREEQARRVRNLITPRSVVQHWAWEELQHTRLADMRPERYQARLDKALRDRARALADGNAMQAVNAVQEARMANELIHLSREFLQRRDKLVTLAKATAAAKAGTFPPLYTAALRKLLGRFGLGTMRGGTDPVLATFSLRELVQKTVAEEDMEGVAPSFADWLLNGVNPATGISLGNGTLRLGGLTPFEMEEVENLLKYLRHAGYNERAEARKSEAAKVQLLEDAAVAAMRDLPGAGNAPAHTLRRSMQEGGRGLYAAIDSLRWEMRKADGFRNVDGQGDAGPMEQMFNEMLAGEERARARVGQISRDMAPHLVHLSQSVAAWEKKYGKHLMLKGQDGKPVKLPESLDKAYGKGWTADMVLALALNCGNDSNMARLVTGYPDLGYDTLAEILGDAMATRAFNAARGTKEVPRGNRHGLLSAADWQAVQGIWDALASQWEDTQKVHERMFGFRPKGVEAAPFRVADGEGNVVSLRGGYYPVRYDPNVSQQVAQWGEKEDLLSRNESVFAVPAARRGHTQARSERAPGLPVRLNTGIIMEHINDVVRLIELGEITRRADRVTQGAAFRAEYIRAFGKEDYEAIRPNLRGLVRQEPPPKNDVAVMAANFVRRYLVPWGLAWNIKVAALQMTAVFPAMGDLGGGPMLRSMAHMARHPLAIREIWAVSPYMKSRMDNIDQDLQRNIANFNPGKRPASIHVGGKEISWDDVVNLGMLPIVAVDATATAAVWMAAYTKKLSALQGAKDVRYGINTESEFHEQAVAFADSMVKQSNPDYDPSSRSGFLRAQNAYRLLNGFASAVTLFAARHKYMYTARKKGKISRWQLARFELYETLLPACAMFLFLALARGYWGDKDEPEDIAKLAIGSLADFATMRVPIFGSAVGDGLLNIMGLGDGGRQGGLRTTIDEPLRQLGILTGRVGQLPKKGLRQDTVKNLSYAVGDALSFALRVPFSKLARNAERGYDQWQRGQGTAFSVLMPRPGK